MNSRVAAWALIAFSFFVEVRADTQTYDFPPGRGYVLPVSMGEKLLHPCSRSAPKPSAAFWQPQASDLDELESKLVPYLESERRRGKELPPFGSYDRQYIGIRVASHKFIYGNFFPQTFREFDPEHRVIDMCDPGPRLWGILFDPKEKTFSKLSFSAL